MGSRLVTCPRDQTVTMTLKQGATWGIGKVLFFHFDFFDFQALFICLGCAGFRVLPSG